MDPDATLRLILEAVRDGEREQLRDSLADLCRWVSTGGFLPDPHKVGPCRHDLHGTEHQERQRHAR